MATATFDTLKFANTLKAAGVPDKQAEAQATVFADALQVNFKELATKEDLDRMAKELKRELAEARDELKREISEVRDDLKRDVREESQKLNAKIDTGFAKQQGENILIRWMLGAAMTGIIGILVRLFVYKTPL